MTKAKDPPIRVRHKKAPEHRFIFADGAISRFTASKSFAFDFFLGTFDINDEIYKNEELERTVIVPDELPYTREIQTTIIMTPNSAKILRDMIDQKLRESKVEQ